MKESRSPWSKAVEVPASAVLGAYAREIAAAIVERPVAKASGIPVVKRSSEQETEEPIQQKIHRRKRGLLRRGMSVLLNPLKWPRLALRACRKTLKWASIGFAGYAAACGAYLSYVSAAAPSSTFNASANCKLDIYRDGKRMTIDETFNTTYSSQQQRFLNGKKKNPAIFGDAKTPDQAIDACFEEVERINSVYSSDGLIKGEVSTSDEYAFGQMLRFTLKDYAAGNMKEARTEFVQGTREAFAGLTGYGYPNFVQRGMTWLFDKTGITKVWDGVGAVATFLYPWNISLPVVQPGAYCELVDRNGSKSLYATRFPNNKSRPDVVTAALQKNSGVKTHWTDVSVNTQPNARDGESILRPLEACALAVKASMDAGKPVYSVYYGTVANMDADFNFQQQGTSDPYIVNSTDPKYYDEMVEGMRGVLNSTGLVMTERSAKTPGQLLSELTAPVTESATTSFTTAKNRVGGAWNVLVYGPSAPVLKVS